MTTCWAILTGEYPPQSGGVSDYTRLVARALADAGDEVHVWAPPIGPHDNGSTQTDGQGVTVHRLPDHFGKRALAALDNELPRLPPTRRLLVQYVPHAFGSRAMNVRFCWWLRTRCADPVWTVFHEVAFPWVASPIHHNLLAAAHRLMARLVARGSNRIFITTPAWRSALRGLARRDTALIWTPVPSNLPTAFDAAEASRIRRSLFSAGPVIGHFSTFPANIAHQLRAVLPLLLEGDPARGVLLAGRGSREFAADFLAGFPKFHKRIAATGSLDPDAVINHLAACDVLLQPYPDGVTCRRSSVMAGLAAGLPIVTTTGESTEDIWAPSGAVALAPADSPTAVARQVEALLADPAGRRRLGDAAQAYYREHFSIEKTVTALRAEGATTAPELAEAAR